MRAFIKLAILLSGLVLGGQACADIVVRARGTTGQESISLQINGSTVQSWTLTTALQNYTSTTTASGEIRVAFTNDAITGAG